MRINDHALINFCNGDAVIEGLLHHKHILSKGFKERWFKLKSNILFYFTSGDTRQAIQTKPSGAYVLENCTVAYANGKEIPFGFSITFRDDVEKGEREHLFACQSDEKVNLWVSALKEASYEFWRKRLLILQLQISKKTGQDPLLMYHRSEGSRLPLPPEDKNVKFHKFKGQKKNTFQSYVGSVRNDEGEPAERSKSTGLLFCDDHFGSGLNSNGLTTCFQKKENGDSSKPSRVPPLHILDDGVCGEPTVLVPRKLSPLSEEKLKSPAKPPRTYNHVQPPLVPQRSTVPGALTPVRIAPPPPVPTRPPRVYKPSANLIDL